MQPQPTAKLCRSDYNTTTSYSLDRINTRLEAFSTRTKVEPASCSATEIDEIDFVATAFASETRRLVHAGTKVRYFGADGSTDRQKMLSDSGE